MAPRLVFLLFLGMACSSTEKQPDYALYRQALEEGSRSAQERLDICKELSNAPARGDCGSNVVQWAARNKTAEPEALCVQVEEGTWRSECFFQMAEHWRRRKNKNKAAENCAQAGPFKNDCEQHLWQGEVRRLTRPRDRAPLRPDEFSSIMPAADRLFAEWNERLGADSDDSSDFDARFWRLVFQQVLETRPGLDLEHCEELEEFHRDHCRRASAHLYLRRLQQFLPRGGGIERFCGLSEDSLSGVKRGVLGPVGLDAKEDPLLLEVLERAYDHVCRRKAALPVSSDWLLPPRKN